MIQSSSPQHAASGSPSLEAPPLPDDLAWAAYLLAAWWDEQGVLRAPAAAADPRAVVELLRRNGVPLLTLAQDSRPPAATLLATPVFQAAITEHQNQMLRQQAAFGEIQRRWADCGIPALFVKALGPRPTFPYISSNLDILVPQAQQEQARKVVRDLGYVELRHIEEPNKFLFRRYHLAQSAFDIHIHGRLEWHVEFLDTTQVWQRSVAAPDTGLAVMPAVEDGILIALAHAIYENKTLKLIELAKLIYAARRCAVDWERVVDGAARRGWLPGLWFALASYARWEQQLYGSASLPAEIRARAEAEMPGWCKMAAASLFARPPQAPVSIGFVRSKRLYYEKILSDPSETPLERGRDVIWHTLYGTRVKLRLHSQKPYLIALEGVDGGGKSAQAELFARALAGAALRHRIVWTRGGSSALLRPLLAVGKALLGRSERRGQEGVSADYSLPLTLADRETDRGQLFRHPLVRAVWPWLIALELGIVYQGRVRWPLWRGEVVVADRYVLSALMELGARLDHPHIETAAAARLLRWLAPRPDCTYCFDVPWETALMRKAGQESADFLQKQVKVLPPLAERLAAFRLDGTQAVDALSDRLIPHALRRYLNRHRTLLNGLFWANPRPLPADALLPEAP